MIKTITRTKPELFGTGPVLPVSDIAATANYYCAVLGFELDFVMGEPPSHGSVTRGRVGIQFTNAPSDFSPRAYPGWFYFFVDDVDALYAEYCENGVGVEQELKSHEHGMREFEIVDCNGFRLRFGQYI